jgi:polar amino acid transport system substrate-binding protein
MRRVAPFLVFFLAACVTPDRPGSSVVRDLAPTGKLRAAINYGNGVLAQKGPNGEARGVSVDLARELAKRLDVPLELVTYDAAGKVTADVKSGAWDIAFVARDPKRAEDIEFTAPYVIVEGGYMVPAGSPLQSAEDVDRDGVRIAVGRGSAYDLYLSRALKHARLVRPAPAGPAAAIELFERERPEAYAGVKPAVVDYARAHPEVRVLPGRFMLIEQAMATPKGRTAGAEYLSQFIDEMKASGFVAAALERSGQRDAMVAP